MALAVVALLLLVLVVVLWRRTSRLSARLEGLTRGEEGRSLEAILDAHLERVHAVARGLEDLDGRTDQLERGTTLAVQRVGLVRFNPFEDTGGNQSFALAMIDANGDGVIISSLHARTGTRVYGKAVSAGKPEGALSDEEAEALLKALRAPTVANRPAV